MKIVVIGGTGLIGRQVVKLLQDKGHEAVAASPNTGVNTITGEGLAEALTGARVVVDVANSPSFADQAVLDFFTTAGHNLARAETEAGVGHHVALSIVGTDRAPDAGYLRAKVAQEEIVKASGIPYTIVRSTQFFEFLRPVADGSTDGDTVRVPAAKLQPIAAKDVALFVAEAALAEPVNGTYDIAGPEAIAMDELIRTVLAADDDPRKVEGSASAEYFGTKLTDTTLTPTGPARLGATSFAAWLDA
jgi:uncharacterized protein YbjT (DUF2867 family)